MLKFPYGKSDFYSLITDNYFYVDRTAAIPLLEEASPYLLFLRPRRFGKSLLRSMLENYYDVAKASEFEKLFGHLAIGSKPTPKHNQYLVMTWDFSTLNTAGEEVREVQRSLDSHLNGCIEQFKTHYRDLLSKEIEIDPNNAIHSFQMALIAVSQTPYGLYLLIDEYDKFANDVIRAGQTLTPARADALIAGERLLRTVFNAVKSATSGRGLERVLMTGVWPVALAGLITYGYDISTHIYSYPEFNDLCGFREEELEAVLTQLAVDQQLPPAKVTEALSLMKTFYQGVRFNSRSPSLVYNPTLALYFFQHFQLDGGYPEEFLDPTLALDRPQLADFTKWFQGEAVIAAALREDTPITLPKLSGFLSFLEFLEPKRNSFAQASLLYYFGALTRRGPRTIYGDLELWIPNLVIRQQYVELRREQLLPDPADRQEAQRVVKSFYRTGEFQPLANFVEQHRQSLFGPREANHANESVTKEVLATLLFDNTFYVTDSEPALPPRAANFTMLVRPDQRHHQFFDVLIEFNFLNLGDVELDGGEKLTSEKVKSLTLEQLKTLPAIQAALVQATTPLPNYRRLLQNASSNPLRLRVYAVVAVGFERLVWLEVNEE
jgi:hypothetical protein